ncbi:MAG: HlyC/CorC family transporter [Propionibacteriales bacterium]|nr:HlyC/CorC family transporter [Propionibacteriales bacterium]
MSGTLRGVIFVLVFIAFSGVFVMAEIALVSLRDSQAKGLEGRGRRGDIVAKLNADPNRFLAAVQVGVTLFGFMSAAFGGAKLAGRLAPVFEGWGLSPGAAETVALIAITLAISYVSLVVGELAPKRLALQRAESISLAVAPTVDRFAKLARPVIWLLSVSTDVVVRLLGGDPGAQREQITDAELRELVSGSETLGPEERQIVEEVFEAGGRQIREVMVPRTEVDFIAAQTPAYKAAQFTLEQPHSRYPVIGESSDDIVGFVHVRDLFDPRMANRSVRVQEIARDVLLLPATRQILSALTDMRREGAHLAIVVDEYGGTAGIITLEDLVEELVGDIKDEYDVKEPETTRSLTGEVEVDGLLNLDDFEDETGLVLPEGPYETVAGYIIQQLGHVPVVGETARFDSHTLTVTELDGRRVARVTVAAARREADKHDDDEPVEPDRPEQQPAQQTPTPQTLAGEQSTKA